MNSNWQSEADDDTLLQVDEALGKLAGEDPDLAKFIELRFFAGLTNREAAQVVDAMGANWLRGHGGGLSTVSAAFAVNTDHLNITSALAAHGGTGGSPTGYDNAGTISGFIITDQPVVTMSPNSVYGNRGDSVALSAYAIGVPPLTY